MAHLSVVAMLAAVAAPQAAAARSAPDAESRATFDIPAQPLASALLAFSRSTARQILVSPSLTEGRVSRPVHGRISHDLALERMLAGSGLRATTTPGGVLMIGPAAAPPDRARPQDAAPPAATLAEVVVTTQKRPQAADDVPFALSVVSGRDFERLRVFDLADVARATPGLVVAGGSPTTMGFSVRGITQNSGDATREPRVSVFQDGVSASRARGAYFELFDLERVEIARGPQSTLFGRSAMTGAVNVIQRKPSLAGSTWQVTAAGGDAGGHLLEGVANVAGTGTAARLAFRTRRWDGDVANALGPRADSESTDALRASVRWAPDERRLVDLIVNYERDRPSAMALKALHFAPTEPLSGRPIGDLGRSGAVALSGRDDAGQPAALGLDRTLSSGALLVDWRLDGAWKLSSVTGLRRFDADERQDADGSGLPAVGILEETRAWQASQELRLHYDGASRWSGFIGVNLFRERGTQRATFVHDERLLLARFVDAIARFPQPLDELTDTAALAGWVQEHGAAHGHMVPAAQARAIAGRLRPAYVEVNQNFGDTRSYEAFGELVWRPAERWEITAGLRYGRDSKQSAVATGSPLGPSALGGLVLAGSLPAAYGTALLGRLADGDLGGQGLVFQPTAGNGGRFGHHLNDGGWSWRLSSLYAATPDLRLYANYARGRRPTVLVAAAPSTPYGPARFTVVPSEVVDSIEAGVKHQAPNGRLHLTAGAYRYAYRHFQTTKAVAGVLRTLDVGDADGFGFETEATARLRRNVVLKAAYGYSHARLSTGAYSGHRFRLAPDHAASASLEMSWELPAGRLTLTPAYSWQSKVYFADDNDVPELSQGLVRDTIQDELQEAYGVLDLHAELAPASGRWAVFARVSNATDVRYLREASSVGESFGFPASIAGQRRRILVGFTLRR